MQKIETKKTPMCKDRVVLTAKESECWRLLVCKFKNQHYIIVSENFGYLYTKILVDEGGGCGGGNAQLLLVGKRNLIFSADCIQDS